MHNTIHAPRRFARAATLGAVLATMLALAPAHAQQAAPGYSGPSSVQLMTVKQLIDTGRDDQHARLRGRIVSHDGGDNYTFADDTGRIPVEISHKRFPPGQAVGAEQLVEISGEFEKGFRKVEFEVERMVVVTDGGAPAATR